MRQGRESTTRADAGASRCSRTCGQRSKSLASRTHRSSRLTWDGTAPLGVRACFESLGLCVTDSAGLRGADRTPALAKAAAGWLAAGGYAD
eukprot:970611-Rhodomonas_salina.2